MRTSSTTRPQMPSGGILVVTAFHYEHRRQALLIWMLHHRVKHDVSRAASGFLGVGLYHDRRHLVLRSVSLWASFADIYTMGEVASHVEAARLPRRLGIKTRCGIFSYSGDWRALMFGAPIANESPLTTTFTDCQEEDQNV